MSENINEVVIDTKLFNKFVIHKLLENGGSIKFNNFGIRVTHNPSNPHNPYLEVRLFAIPIGTIYKGNVNPSLSKKIKNTQKIKIEEDEVINM